MKLTNILDTQAALSNYKKLSTAAPAPLNAPQDKILLTESAAHDVPPAAHMQPLQKSVLHQGDLVTKLQSTSIASFSSIVAEILRNRMNKIRRFDNASKAAINHEASTMEIMEAVQTSQKSLQEAVTVLSKFVEAYKSIIQMPL
jgi:flagellar hook-basal body complex protein FliE